MQASNSNKLESPLALPAPNGTNANEDSKKLEVNGIQKISLDELGSMVVNSDGTLSRIANWQNLTDAERERTLRVLSARNRLRLANEEKKQRDAASSTSTSTESDDGTRPVSGSESEHPATSTRMSILDTPEEPPISTEE